MKTRFYVISVIALAGAIILNSCTKDDTPTALEASKVVPNYILGTWKNDKDPKDFKKYTTQKSGAYPDATYQDGSDWYVGETTEGQEGTEFYWKLEGNQLTEQYKNMETWIPRKYTLMTLSTSKLEYFDGSNDITSFSKQN